MGKLQIAAAEKLHRLAEPELKCELLITMVGPMISTTVWPWFCSAWPMVWRKSAQSGQWWSKSVWSGQGWPKSVRSGQYLSLGMVGLANACLGYGRSGQYLSWAADFILGSDIKFSNTCLDQMSSPYLPFSRHQN